MDLEVSVAVIGSLLTAALVAITWRYAKSTEEIARETTRAAAAARTTAQVNLLQSLLSVQPMLEVSALGVEYWHGETLDGPAAKIPFRVSWSIGNSGSGSAFNPTFSARIGRIDLPITQSTEIPAQLVVGQVANVAHQSERSTWSDLAHPSGDLPTSGELLFSCRDAYGASIGLRAVFRLDGKTASLASVERSYEGGEELREMLQRLLATLRNQP